MWGRCAIGLTLCVGFSGCFGGIGINTVVIPEVSEYANGVRFTGDTQFVRSKYDKAPSHPSYVRLEWKPVTPKKGIKCPFEIDLESKTLRQGDFEYENFLKCGGVDGRYEYAKEFGKKLEDTGPPAASLIDDTSNVLITCHYDGNNAITSIEVVLGYTRFPTKTRIISNPIKVTMNGKTCELPTDHKGLVKAFGEPSNHVEERVEKANHAL